MLHALAGAGNWDGAKELFDDIASFLRTVTTLSAVCTDTPEFYDDDLNIAPQGVEIIEKELSGLFETPAKTRDVLMSLGWI